MSIANRELQYDTTTMKFSELEHNIVVPPFQRGLVWNNEKKREFIKTLKAGLPIGVLLLSRKKDEPNKFLVIDGLQRFTTMIEYKNNFFGYLEKDEVTDSDVMPIIMASQKAYQYYDESKQEAKEKYKDEIRSIISSHISSEGAIYNANILSKNISNDIKSQVAIIPEEDIEDIRDMVYQLVEGFKAAASIDDIEVPVIIFNGSDNDLATIFQKLNQEGVKLTKYDVFAATWIEHSVNVKGDNSLIDIIKEKYESAQEESGLEIAGYDPDELTQVGELTDFEYAFALGKIIMKECPTLFPKYDIKGNDSLGFLLLAELMGLKYQDMENLANKMDEYKDVLDYSELKDALVTVSKQVEKALCPYIITPTTKKSKKASLVCHSELQIASFIIVMFLLQYNLSKDEGLTKVPGMHKELRQVKHNMYKHYLYDIIRDNWSGSGDKKLEDIIVSPQTCRYVGDIEQGKFRTAIEEWITTYNEPKSLKTVTPECKLFLNYLLRLRYGSTGTVEKRDFDIEHCVPKKVIKKYFFDKGTDDIPMSSICNMVFIPEKENRGKGEWTYYQKQKYDHHAYSLNKDELDKLLYPTESELKFVEIPEEITEENYMNYLKHRETTVVNAMMDALY